MHHTIEKLDNKLSFLKDKKLIELNGYAFIDECNYCIIIVYGEHQRDLISRYLKSNLKDDKGLKYKYINLKL